MTKENVSSISFCVQLTLLLKTLFFFTVNQLVACLVRRSVKYFHRCLISLTLILLHILRVLHSYSKTYFEHTERKLENQLI